jgi:predicted transcriptional regulator
MKNNPVNSLKFIFADLDLTQKEIAKILNVSQAALSKKILSLNFNIEEILTISNAINKDLFTELSTQLLGG